MAVKLINSSQSIKIELLEFGLTVHKLLVKVDDSYIDIIPGFEKEEDYINLGRKFLHSIIGRYTNRLEVKEHKIKCHNGNESSLNPEPVESDKVSHHGGLDSFDRQFFKHVRGLDQVKLFDTSEFSGFNEESYAIFNYVSNHGDNGYPGNMLIEVLVLLTDNDVLINHRSCMLDENVPCPINLTQHWGFNLTAQTNKSSTIHEHELKINSNYIIKSDDENNLPTGYKLPIDDTNFDFNTSRKINEKGEVIHDHYYFFNKEVRDPTIVKSVKDLKSIYKILNEPNEGLVELKVPQLKLKFDTNQSGVMFYGGLGFNESAPRRKLNHRMNVNDDNEGYPINGCAFFEFHHPLSTFTYKDYEKHAKTTTILNGDEGNIYSSWVKISVH